MYTDLPSLTRCCFCAPLRSGILVWAYIKLVLSILLLAGFLLFLSGMIFVIFFTSNTFFFLALFLFSMIIMLFDVAFNFVLIIGIHKRNTTMLRLYFRYGLAYTVTMIIFFLLTVSLVIESTYEALENHELLVDIGLFASGLITLLILHNYLLLLIRSEIQKLKGNAQFKFENHAADPKCFMQATAYSIESSKAKEAEANKTLP